MKKVTAAFEDIAGCGQEKDLRQLRGYTELDELILPKNCVVLLECMSNLVANEMFREDGFHPEVSEKITEGVRNLLSQAEHVVIVTNEIFSDGILYEGEPKSIRNSWDSINCNLAGNGGCCCRSGLRNPGSGIKAVRKA